MELNIFHSKPQEKKKKSTYQGMFLEAEALNEPCKIMWIFLHQSLQSHAVLQ